MAHLPLLTHDLLTRLCAARELLVAADDPPLSLRDISRVADVPLTQLIRRFTTLFGETPHRYRTRLRLERATTLLLRHEASVTAVCMTLGYSSLGSFSWKFSRHFGTSPVEYRRRFHPSAAIPKEPAWLDKSGCCALLIAGLNAVAQFPRNMSGGMAEHSPY